GGDGRHRAADSCRGRVGGEPASGARRLPGGRRVAGSRLYYPKRGTTFEGGLSDWSNGTFAVPNGRTRGSNVRGHKRLLVWPSLPAHRPSAGARRAGEGLAGR